MKQENMTSVTSVCERIRHPFKARYVQLSSREQISPKFIRLTLIGEMRDFASDGFDDHFKLLLPEIGQEKPLLPELIDGKPLFTGPRPVMRDYTPMRWTTNTLTVDFALHDDGPATHWARTAPIGSWAGIAGPRGSLIISKNLAWYWLFADASGLPAVIRALTELPAHAQITVRLTGYDCDHRDLPAHPQLDVQWVDSLSDAAQSLVLPKTLGFIWAAGEHHEMAALREVAVAKGASPKHMRIAAYWKQGQANHHEELSEKK